MTPLDKTLRQMTAGIAGVLILLALVSCTTTEDDCNAKQQQYEDNGGTDPNKYYINSDGECTTNVGVEG